MDTLLVIFTGGTICSAKRGHTINVDEAGAYELIRKYRAGSRQRDVDFETLRPFQRLSENIVPDDWKQLISCLSSVDLAAYKGIIVTHGSDTLSFTAACLSYAFHDTHVPIVLVASNYPLDDERSNGLRNFANAVDFIADRPLPGIFVLFENDRGTPIIYLGTRIMQALPFTDQFDSPYSVHFGEMAEGILQLNRHPLNPTLERLMAVKERRLPASDRLQFSSDILYIKPFPGMNYRYYEFAASKPKAVLHDLYHSGTACTRQEESAMYSLQQFIGYCRSIGVPVYLSPLKNIAGDLYSSSVELLQTGATALENISTDAALVKLMLAYGTFDSERDIASLMMSDDPLFFEHCAPLEDDMRISR